MSVPADVPAPSTPTLPHPVLPRDRETPIHAHAADVQLVAAPVVRLDDVAWPQTRAALVDDARLHADEARLADALAPVQRGTFVSGRLALRQAMAALLQRPLPEVPAVGRSSRGAPALPLDVAGSITHKRDVAMAVAVHCTEGLRHVGVDLERRPTERDLARPSIATRILTAHELARLHDTLDDELARRERTLLLFSLKEAVYKAIDPIVGRYVRFTEVEIDVPAPHEAAVRLHLPELANDDLRIVARWFTDGPWIVSAAFAYR